MNTCNGTNAEYECGSASMGFECKQPGQCPVQDIDRIGDGQCDVNGGFNTKICGWDGE